MIQHTLETPAGEISDEALVASVPRVFSPFRHLFEEGPFHRPNRYPSLVCRGQVMDCYLVCQGNDGLYLVDQHAAHERIRLDCLLYLADGPGLARQSLLAPYRVRLPPEQMAALDDPSLLGDLGFDVEPFGTGEALVRAVPAVLGRQEDPEGISDILGSLLSGRGHEGREEALKMMSCRGAIKAGDPLRPREMRALLLALRRVRDPWHCAHGRPTTLRMTPAELEKAFRRRV